jgi:hypothetical protein
VRHSQTRCIATILFLPWGRGSVVAIARRLSSLTMRQARRGNPARRAQRPAADALYSPLSTGYNPARVAKPACARQSVSDHAAYLALGERRVG